MPALIDLTGRTFGRLTVVSRVVNAGRGRVQWLCLCTCGGRATVSSGHLSTGHTASCGCRQRDLASKANSKPDDQIGYHAAHVRIKRTRGKASLYSCVDCAGRADEWSLKREAPVTFIGATTGSYACRFSGDPSDYAPRCKNCHATYDRE